MTAREYLHEQNREIDEDDENANGRRKKRKKGGNVKGLTAHHRMDRHVRRQVGGGAGVLPQQMGPATMGAAGAPGIGGAPLGGAGIGGIGGIGAGGGGGLPTGAATIPPRVGGAGVVPQIPAGVGALPRAGVGATNPLGGAAGAAVPGAAMGAGLGGAGIGAGVRPPGMNRGGRSVPAPPIRQGRILSEPDEYQFGGRTGRHGHRPSPRYHQEQREALNGRYDPMQDAPVPDQQPYEEPPDPDQDRPFPPLRRGSEPPIPQQMPPMAHGGRLPKAMREREYNGVEPPQKRERHQVGGGIRIPRRAVGESLGRGVGGVGLGTIGGGGIPPTRVAPRDPAQLPPARMRAGIGRAGFADGGRASEGYANRPRRQRGGRAPADMEDHSPRQAGGRAADYPVRAQRRQVGGGVPESATVRPVPGTVGGYPIRQPQLQPPPDTPEVWRRFKDFPDYEVSGSGRVRAAGQPPPGLGAPPRQQRGGRTDIVGGRYGTADGDRFGHKWVPEYGGVEDTTRIDRSRGRPIREGQVPGIRGSYGYQDGVGPGDNVSDFTIPMADGGRLTAKERRALPKSDFAIPEKNGYPLPDESHGRSALSLVSQHGSPSEKRRVRADVARKFPGISQSKSGGGRSC